jgi:DNA-binding CsgD family transcriptional regulator
MEQSSDAEALLLLRQTLHSAIQEHRVATEELKTVTKELEALLVEMAAREDLRSLVHDVLAAPTESIHPPRQTPLDGSLPGVSQLKRDFERAFHKSEETISEAVAWRTRSRRLRMALRSRAAGALVDGNGSADGRGSADGSRLSKREHQVLNLMVEGKSSKEIAAALGISFKTAVTHRASIMGKLDVHEIASVVREAIRRGLV